MGEEEEAKWDPVAKPRVNKDGLGKRGRGERVREKAISLQVGKQHGGLRSEK